MNHPFSIFPTELLAHDLSALELRVLIALYSFRGKNTNTVWPSLYSLAEVAGIADKTTVSKITTRLAEKGMLTKKKRGFTGGNEYELIVPEADKDSNLDESSNFDKKTTSKESNLDESSNLEESCKSNLDESSNSNLDESSKCNEQTIEHTNEQTSITSSGDDSHPVKPKKAINHQAIVDLYNQILPELPTCKVLTDKRKSAINGCCSIKASFMDLGFWEAYFTAVRKSDFLMGRSKDWKADFDFLTTKSKLVKAYEGGYQ